MKTKHCNLHFVFALILFNSCQSNTGIPTQQDIAALNLKRGTAIFCGTPEDKVGTVHFAITATDSIQKQFNFATALLHSFEYDEAEKAFSKIIVEAPACAMAYWGVAMSNYHPLWTAPEELELKKGAAALELAKKISAKSERETDYINTLSIFYKDWQKTGHLTRCRDYESAMAVLYKKYPNDKEAAIFYALALDAAADPADKTFARQKKAGEILKAVYPGEPDHPGIIHYIIHTYDYPVLAAEALDAARKYASVAPASAHAQHMPSHIFTRLGLWDEAIQSNIASTESAKCYAQSSGIKGHWDEELHGLDYLEYAYLQKRDLAKAKAVVDYLETIKEVSPINFKEAYAFAAIPSRYILENKLWKDAVTLTLVPGNFPWKKFPWQQAIVYFTRAVGEIHLNKLKEAKNDIAILTSLHDQLLNQKDSYKANQVAIQMKAAAAWLAWKENKLSEAEAIMNEAALMEDKTEKHPVTPCEVLPAREMLADLYMEMKMPGKALENYKADLESHPNRYNAVKGVTMAARQ